MAIGKRRSIHTNPNSFGGIYSTGNIRASTLNFRPNASQEDRGGTRPTGEAHSIGFVFVSLFLHICKKSLLFDTTLKVATYCVVVFIGSVIADTVTIPKSYFARSDNALNRYFIKWGWGWLLVTTTPWIAMTAHTIGCGRKSYLLKHLGRLVIATSAWLLWMRLFGAVERNFGRCLNTKSAQLQTRTSCLQAGLFWSGLDISGHTFIIIYSSLILAEEGAAFVGWERIRDLVMNERHTRTIEGEISRSCLRSLSDNDLEFLKNAHNLLSPYLRGLFVVMTVQQIFWDIMLMATIFYYHTLVEKLMGMIPAFIMWYLTYHWWYRKPMGGLLSPGDGLFKYNERKKEQENLKTKRSASNRTMGPTFMGRPLRTGGDEGEQWEQIRR